MNKDHPTDEELDINEKLLKQCNHSSHTTETGREDGYDYYYLICTKCGERFDDDDHPYLDKNYSKKPDDYCKKFIPLHCHDVVMARKLLRQLEELGWKLSFTNRNNAYICNITKGIRKFTSDETPTEQAAICNAAHKASMCIT